MTSQMMNLLARVDGLPVELIAAERIWPTPAKSTTSSARETPGCSSRSGGGERRAS